MVRKMNKLSRYKKGWGRMFQGEGSEDLGNRVSGLLKKLKDDWLAGV